jgi:putative sigma-54 modulation protein
MNINIKASNTTLTDAIRDVITDKVNSLESLTRPEDKIHVEIEVSKRHNSGDIFRVEVSIQPHGEYADGSAEDMYQAVDLVIPKIREQLAKQKDKKISLRRKLGNLFKFGGK